MVEGGRWKGVNSKFGIRNAKMRNGWRVTSDGLRVTSNSQPATNVVYRRGAEAQRRRGAVWFKLKFK